MTARVEVPGVAGPDVETSLLFEPLTSTWDDLLDQSLYDGVHAGLANAGMPLPGDGIRVSITELRLAPLLAVAASEREVRSVAETIHTLIAAMVAGLWTGLRRSTTVVAK